MFPATVTVLLQPAPLQPAKVEPAAGVAVSATWLPLLTTWLQSLPQLMPVAVTVPLPVPAFTTVNV
jgi:hypothetical protein